MMINPIFLESWYLTQAFEVVVATVIILVTGFIAFMLFLSVRRDFKTEIENRKMLKQSGQTEDEKDNIITERKAISKKSKDILALIDQELYRAKEGEVSVLFYLNLDNFRHVSQQFGKDKTEKVIEEITARLRRTGDKKSVAGNHEQDIFLYYLPGPVDNEVI
ncbi:MAG: diguanylate cyclase, partial [bacterium]